MEEGQASNDDALAGGEEEELLSPWEFQAPASALGHAMASIYGSHFPGGILFQKLYFFFKL